MRDTTQQGTRYTVMNSPMLFDLINRTEAELRERAAFRRAQAELAAGTRPRPVAVVPRLTVSALLVWLGRTVQGRQATPPLTDGSAAGR
jgi:hypothetical protein